VYKPVFYHLFLQFHYISIAVTQFRVRSTLHGTAYVVRIIVEELPLPTATTKFGTKVVRPTATYYSSDCDHKLFYKPVFSALSRKI